MKTQIKTSLHVLLLLLLIALFVTGCGKDTETGNSGSRNADPQVLIPEAPGNEVLSNDNASLDISNIQEGYVMVRYDGDNNKVRMQIVTPQNRTYTYILKNNGTFTAFPLTDGSGSYELHIYENIEGTTYAQVFSDNIEATINNEFSPFLYPNQYVNFDKDSKAVAFGAKLAAGAASDFDVLKNVYQWITDNISYDYDLAEHIDSDYIPDCDKVLKTEKGICFDYAALTCAILRSQGIPTRLVIGYAGQQYHAWISVYLKEKGWINHAIEFHGTDWVRMDPTADAQSAPLDKYIDDNTTYNEMYLY